MMYRLVQLLTLVSCMAFGAQALSAPDTNRLLVLSYHDIRDDVARKGDPDRYATSTQNFAAHLDWLTGQGYRPVRLDEVIAAARGERLLPDKAVLLTFDDGLRSVYTHAFPLLRAYGYPALVAVVTDWVDLPAGREVDYGHRLFTRDDFLTWVQLREMRDSGLIEVASHSHDLHRGVQSNPQGNSTPAAVTRIYDPVGRRYESEAAYLNRIRTDLSASAAAIRRELGAGPRAIVWPYAAYSQRINALADELGMRISFDLEGRDQTINPDPANPPLHGLARLLIQDNPTIVDLAYSLRRDEDRVGVRGLQINLDYVYDPDPAQIERNLDRLIERVKQIGPSHVFLQAFADPDANGSAAALYFPNRHLPMRADLFNRVAWQLRTRAGVKVLAWLPVLGFELPDPTLRRALVIPASGSDEPFRLNPLNADARRIIAGIYQDLAVNSYFEGLLFHDDAHLRDDELIDQIPAAERTRGLIDFTHELERAAGLWRPNLVTVRNLYARPVLEPAGEAWFAQNLDAFLHAYDYTAVMAMPWLEGSREPETWLARLLTAVQHNPKGLERTIFQLQTRDWNSGRPIPPERLQAQARQLLAGGVRHLAWYPDDFIADHPPLAESRAAMSARNFPYLER